MSQSQPSATAALASPDPTATKTLREEFEADAYRRWERVRGDTRRLIESDPIIRPDSDTEPAISYAHLRYDLQQSIENHVLEPLSPRAVMQGRHWTGRYIRDAWEHGINLADAYLLRLGHIDPEAEPMAPRMRSRQEPHRKGLRREFIRAYSDLEDIAADARKDASRTYDEGLRTARPKRDIISTRDGREDGVNNRLDKVGETRTEVLADTYIVAAVNEASMIRYEQAGVEEVGGIIETPEGVETNDAFRAHDHIARLDEDDDDRPPYLLTAAIGALGSVLDDPDDDPELFEFQTAGDDRVCAECASLAGPYSFNEAKELDKMPPIHPNCRCFMAPTGLGRYLSVGF